MNEKYEQRCKLIDLYLENKKFSDYYEEQVHSTKFSITENCENADIVVLHTGEIKIHGEMDDLYDELIKLKDNIEDGSCFAYWFLSCDDLIEKFPGRADNTVRFIKEAISCYLNENNLAAFYMLGVAARKAQDEYQKVDDTFSSRIADVIASSQRSDISEDERVALELHKYHENTKSGYDDNKISQELEHDEIGQFIKNITKLYELMG